MIFKNIDRIKTEKGMENIRLFSPSKSVIKKSTSGWNISNNTSFSSSPSVTGSVYFSTDYNFSISYASENTSSVYSEYLPWNSLMSYMGVPYNISDGKYKFHFNGQRITEAVILEFEDDYVNEGIDNDSFVIALSGSTTNTGFTENTNGSLPSSDFLTLASYFKKIGSNDTINNTNAKSSQLSPSYELRSNSDDSYLTVTESDGSVKIDWGVGTASDPYGVLYPQHGIALIFPELITDTSITNAFNDSGAPRAKNVLNSIMYMGGYGTKKSQKYIFSIKAEFDEFNNTLNPTTYEYADGEQRKKEIYLDSPTTFVSQVGIYNDANELLLTANLSKPDKKDELNFLGYKITVEL